MLPPTFTAADRQAEFRKLAAHYALIERHGRYYIAEGNLDGTISALVPVLPSQEKEEEEEQREEEKEQEQELAEEEEEEQMEGEEEEEEQGEEEEQEEEEVEDDEKAEEDDEGRFTVRFKPPPLC